MTILRVYSCHRSLTHTCSMVLSPHSSMHVGTQATMPYLRPSAAPAGWRATKKAKKSATAVFRSPFLSPISDVKCADSALPICRFNQHTCGSLEGADRTLDLSRELKRNSRARKGKRSVSSFNSVRLCRREVAFGGSSSSFSSMVCRVAEMRESSCCWTIAEEWD